ncbi:hypothetical protein ACQP6C_04025 [Snodgrassella alvi]|uniref:hypothetical protein n=1 Tax=Snodgrassella alvi TaxID=1196083 RepID=UPI003D05A326
MMKKAEKFFSRVIGPLIIVLGIICLAESKSNHQHYYLPLQNKAKYLLSLNCAPNQCTTQGKMIYNHPENISAKSISTPIYHFRYYFRIADKTYINDDLRVFSEGFGFTKTGLRYFPAGGLNSAEFFSEEIIFDPDNPNINLPVTYAKVLHEIPSPYGFFEGFFIIIGGIILTLISYWNKIFLKSRLDK